MPFTPAHIAAVLPFLKAKRLSATGLIAGSVAPDFEYFLKMNVDSQFSHTLLGLFYFDVPVALCIACVFHSVVKPNLVANLPLFFQRRFENMRNLPFLEQIRRHSWAFLLSCLLGSATHLFWDSFTHNNAFFVKALPSIYEGTFVPLDGVNYPLWYALQHISTFAGLTVLVGYVVLMKPGAGPVNVPLPGYWVCVVAISATILAIRFQFHFSEKQIGSIVVSSITALCLAVIGLGFISFNNSIQAQPRE